MDRAAYWKWAFLFMLPAFEIAREVAVLGAYKKPQVAAFGDLNSYGSFTLAQGTWKRLGFGDPLAATAVRIECDRDEGRCIVATSTASDFTLVPFIDNLPAKFGSNITFSDDSAICVNTTYRIDLQQKRTIATRLLRGDTGKMPACKALEPRIDMELVSSMSLPVPDPFDGHFLPILRTVRGIMGRRSN